ncbi:MAG: MiaB/RimO family radical SAM methylthiotransferase [candidate division WOR-3 bacterium]
MSGCKRFFILTLGCPKNLVDSERIAGALSSLGHSIVFSPHEADMIILNTCAFISAAEDEAKEYIDRFSKEKPLLVVGCLPARRKGLKRRYGDTAPEAEMVIQLSDAIFRDPEAGTRLIDTAPYAYLKIAEGCSRRCSFCVIPRIRGRLRSRRIEDIVSEARALIELGKREVIIVAQDTSQFGRDTGESLEKLLVEIDRLEGDFWLRLMYLHPVGMTRRLALTLRSLDHLVPYLHMPVQHVSDRVLRAMLRAGGLKAVRRAIGLIERYLPDAFLRTEIMVGFPEETEDDFKLVISAIESGLFRRVAVFPFFREKGSPAYKMPQIPAHIIDSRYQEAAQAARGLHERVQGSLVGNELRVIVDEPGLGRTEYDAPEVDFSVAVPEGLEPGSLCSARIIGVDEEGDLMAEISPDPSSF